MCLYIGAEGGTRTHGVYIHVYKTRPLATEGPRHIGHFLLEDALYRILEIIMVPLRLVLEVIVIDRNFLKLCLPMSWLN